MGPSRQPATDGQLLDRERLAARLWDLLEANGVRRDDPAAAAAGPSQASRLPQ
jgi:hypothetical protein